LITVPAAVAFLGLASVAGQGTFGLGFTVLPLVFAKMPLGAFFGGAFFFMLFLAAITSSISMLQPGIAFLEEAMNVGRKVSP
jgi:NSS family neurotransmitter:Na+ symporter